MQGLIVAVKLFAMPRAIITNALIRCTRLALTGLASECGFNIEIYVRPDEDDPQVRSPND